MFADNATTIARVLTSRFRMPNIRREGPSIDRPDYFTLPHH